MDPVKIKCVAICRGTTICVLSCVKKMLNFPKSFLLVHVQRLSHCFNIITTKCSWLRCHLCVRCSLTSCDMRATPHQFFFFCVGGKTELVKEIISWYLCNLLHLEKVFSSIQTFHSIQYHSPSLASLQRCALTRGIANTIRTQSKWLFTPLHKTHWTIPTSIITSMDLNETKNPSFV